MLNIRDTPFPKRPVLLSPPPSLLFQGGLLFLGWWSLRTASWWSASSFSMGVGQTLVYRLRCRCSTALFATRSMRTLATLAQAASSHLSRVSASASLGCAHRLQSPITNLYYCLVVARYYSPHTELCCVRVAREHVRMLRAALSLVRFVQRQPAILTVLQTCGMSLTRPTMHPHSGRFPCSYPPLPRAVTGSPRTLRNAMVTRLHACETELGDDATVARKELARLQRELLELQREA